MATMEKRLQPRPSWICWGFWCIIVILILIGKVMGFRRVVKSLLILTVTANWFARRSSSHNPAAQSVIKLIKQRQQQIGCGKLLSERWNQRIRGEVIYLLCFIFHLIFINYSLADCSIARLNPKRDSRSAGDWFDEVLLGIFMSCANFIWKLAQRWKARWFGYFVWIAALP